MKPYQRRLSLGLLLFILWIILSGHLNIAFLSLGLASCALVTWLAARMNLHTDDMPRFADVHRTLIYAVWLAREIFISNLKVARIILDPKLPIRPVLFWAPATQKTDLGRVVFANSITLTPGTISVEIAGSGQEILVHVLHEGFSWGRESCEMDARIAALGM
ncbi:MAG: cation transporter [Alphaproteobacteria bacterium]|nr:cation transporter [Alphaproteobacteria bacterium]